MDYLHMTDLPEPLERALLDLSPVVLNAAAGITRSSDAYISIQYLAKSRTHDELWALVREPYVVDEESEDTVPVIRGKLPMATEAEMIAAVRGHARRHSTHSNWGTVLIMTDADLRQYITGAKTTHGAICKLAPFAKGKS